MGSSAAGGTISNNAGPGFSDIRRYVPGTHYGLLLVRLRFPGRNALVERIRSLFQNERVEQWERCFVVATELKLRVRRPESPGV